MKIAPLVGHPLWWKRLQWCSTWSDALTFVRPVPPEFHHRRTCFPWRNFWNHYTASARSCGSQDLQSPPLSQLVLIKTVENHLVFVILAPACKEKHNSLFPWEIYILSSPAEMFRPLTSRTRSGLRWKRTRPSGVMFHRWPMLSLSGETQSLLPAITTPLDVCRQQSSTSLDKRNENYCIA